MRARVRNKNASRYLALDPGVDFGWAIFEVGSPIPIQFGVFNSKRSKKWLERVSDSAGELEAILRCNRGIRSVYCEWPQFFDNSGGRAVAIKGDLTKLAVAVGCFMEVCRAQFVDFKPVPINQWKGQLPKDVTNRRIQATLEARDSTIFEEGGGLFGLRSHAWDAVGIGLWVGGYF